MAESTDTIKSLLATASDSGANDRRLEKSLSSAERLSAEWQLLSQGTTDGISQRLQRPISELAGEAAWSTLAGATFVQAAHRFPSAARIGGMALTVGLGLDLAGRSLGTAAAMADTWLHPENVEKNKKIVAGTIGTGLADYAILGLPGYAAIKGGAGYLDLSKSRLEKALAASPADPHKIPSIKHDWLNNVVPKLTSAEGEPALAALYQESRPATVQVIATLRNPMGGVRHPGSGFIVDKEGLLVTNYHVARAATSTRIITGEGEEYTARLVARDRQADLAIMQIVDKPPDKIFPTAKLGSSAGLNEGSPLYMIGHPGGVSKQVISQGKFSRRVSLEQQYAESSISSLPWTPAQPGKRQVEGLTAVIAHLGGSSGSAVRNGRGEVVGVLGWGNDVSGGGTSVEHVKELLRISQELRPTQGWLDVKTSVNAGGQVEILAANHRDRLALAEKFNGLYVKNLLTQSIRRAGSRSESPALTAAKLAGSSLSVDFLSRLAISPDDAGKEGN